MKNKKRIISLVLALAISAGSCGMLCACGGVDLTGSTFDMPQSDIVLPADNKSFSVELARQLFEIDQLYEKEGVKEDAEGNKILGTKEGLEAHNLQVVYQGGYDYELLDKTDASGFTVARGVFPVEGGGTKNGYLIQIRPTTDHEWFSNIDIMMDIYDDKYYDYEELYEDMGKDLPTKINYSRSNYKYTRFSCFDWAAMVIVQTIKEQDFYKDFKDCAVIVTGYSRGAAVANIIAAELNLEANTYGYCFACPYTCCCYSRANLEKFSGLGKCEGIFNVNNPGDIFTHLPVQNEEQYCFRFGKDIVLSSDKDWSADEAGLMGFLGTIRISNRWILGSYYDMKFSEFPLDKLVGTLIPDNTLWNSPAEMYDEIRHWAGDLLLSEKSMRRYSNVTLYDAVEDLVTQVLSQGKPGDDILTRLNLFVGVVQNRIANYSYGYFKPLYEYVTSPMYAGSGDLVETVTGVLGFDVVGMAMQHMADSYFKALDEYK